jgi:hypothetical protein
MRAVAAAACPYEPRASARSVSTVIKRTFTGRCGVGEGADPEHWIVTAARSAGAHLKFLDKAFGRAIMHFDYFVKVL